MLVGLLVACLVFGVQAGSAFNKSRSGTRAVDAAVVTDANAYQSLTTSGCVVPVTGGSCTILTTRNKGTATHTHTLTKSSDPRGLVTTFTPSTFSINVGASQAITATIRARPLGAPCLNNPVSFDLAATTTSPDVGDASRTNFGTLVSYSLCV